MVLAPVPEIYSTIRKMGNKVALALVSVIHFTNKKNGKQRQFQDESGKDSGST